MLEFSVLTSILTVYGKVTMLKHETILNNYLLENNISENNILFGICCIVKLQEYKGIIKNTNMLQCKQSPSAHSYLFILSDACMLLRNALMFCKT